jgi:hypothetical protein
MTCAAMTTLYGGKRVCSVGCLGMGDLFNPANSTPSTWDQTAFR